MATLGHIASVYCRYSRLSAGRPKPDPRKMAPEVAKYDKTYYQLVSQRKNIKEEMKLEEYLKGVGC